MSNRYARQIPLIGAENQKKLQDATVFIAGAGGLGSPVSFYLAGAGIGTLRIADLDIVDESNLNRQILHSEEKIGMKKAVSAKETLEAFNSECRIEAFSEKIDDKSLKTLTGDADLLIDCMDNFETRYALNRYSQKTGIPLLHGAVSGCAGQITLLIPGKTPCLSCIFPKSEASSTQNIIGAYAGVVGSMQAAEAVKYLIGEPSLAGKLLIYDGRANSLDLFSVKKNRNCPVCGEK
ncbi:MAG TPA: HesA/MoeB/ThiF family protein [Methanocorpusculum sp.]|nr:HesA/MoeB/ThiF family protein [Methanocorpusculum sp.]